MNTEERKNQIIEAVLKIIETKGIYGVNIATIAKKIGVVPSAIYRHFKSKNDILISVISSIEKKLNSIFTASITQNNNNISILETILNKHIEMIKNNQGIPQLIFSQETYLINPFLREKVLLIIQNYRKNIEKIISTLIKENKCTSSIDSEAISIIFLGIIQSSAIMWYMSRGTFDINKTSQRAFKLFCKTFNN